MRLILVASLLFGCTLNAEVKTKPNASVTIKCPKQEQKMLVNVNEVADGLVIYTVECKING